MHARGSRLFRAFTTTVALAGACGQGRTFHGHVDAAGGEAGLGRAGAAGNPTGTGESGGRPGSTAGHVGPGGQGGEAGDEAPAGAGGASGSGNPCPGDQVYDANEQRCRAARTCEDLSCTDEACVEANGNDDAHCAACGTDLGFDESSGSCVACLSPITCDGEGTTGRVLAATDGGLCICETLDGYFSTSDGVGECDHDGDGWVNENAQPVVESTNRVIRENARCDVRRVSSFRLVNEAGDEYSIPSDVEDLGATFAARPSLGIPAGLPLYESERNDGSSGELPTYGEDGLGRALDPAEVNGLTRACLAGGDANDNGVTDVEEDPASVIQREVVTTLLERYYETYAAYGYFLELFDGAYAAESGEYVITERQRADYGVPVRYPEDTSAHVQSCERHPDTLYTWSSGRLTAASSVGADFVRFGDAAGIGHPSQFKCVHVVYPQVYAKLGATATSRPELVTVDDATGHLVRLGDAGPVEYAWTTNTCHATADSEAATDENPSHPLIRCAADTAPPPAGSVRWAVVGYENYPNDEPYVDVSHPGGYARGCVNDCAEAEPSWTECFECTPDAAGAEQIGPKGAGLACSSGRQCDGQGTCGDCVPGRTQCQDPVEQVICNEARSWEGNVSCPFGCDPNVGRCFPDCVPGARRCSAGSPELCDATGHYGALPACATGTQCVGEAKCITSDGSPCSKGTDCANGTCSPFHHDADGDGYGDGQVTTLCGTSPPLGYLVNNTDCCDADPNVHPGQVNYFGKPSACNSYDYNCANGAELLYTAYYCYYGCCSDGWVIQIPNCGESGTWYSCGGYPYSTVVQQCH